VIDRNRILSLQHPPTFCAATTTTSPHGHQSLPLMAEGIYNTSSVMPLRQILLSLFLSHACDRKRQLLSGRVFCVGATRPLLKNPGGMALTLKSQPSPHPPTPWLQQDPCPACQPPTTTPPSGRAYPGTHPPAHHHPAAASFGLRKLPPRCPVVVGFGSRIHQAPRRSYARRMRPTTQINPSRDGCIHPCMLPMAAHHPAAVGHSPHCPTHHRQSSAPAYTNAKTSPPVD